MNGNRWTRIEPACLLLIISMCVGCNGEPGHLTPEPAEVLVQYDRDQDKHFVPVKLTNTGGSAIQIGEIRSSCTCAVVSQPKLIRLLPGQDTILNLSVTPQLYGENDQVVSILTDSPSQTELLLPIHISGKQLPTPHIVSQTERLNFRFPDLVTHQERVIEIRTIENTEDSAWVTGVDCDLSGVTIVANPVEEWPISSELTDRLYTYRIQVTPPQSRGIRATLTPEFRFAKPAKPRDIPLTATVTCALATIPSELKIEERLEQQRVLVVSTDNTQFAIRSVEFLPPLTGIRLHEFPKEVARHHSLMIGFSSEVAEELGTS
jgi:hypothetical protein